MAHYVCEGCGGVSEHEGVCTTGECSNKGRELKECDCGDGKHADALLKNSDEENTEDPGDSSGE